MESGLIPDSSLSASSNSAKSKFARLNDVSSISFFVSYFRPISSQVAHSRIFSLCLSLCARHPAQNEAWTPEDADKSPFYQIDFGKDCIIQALFIQGFRPKRAVKTPTLSGSNPLAQMKVAEMNGDPEQTYHVLEKVRGEAWQGLRSPTLRFQLMTRFSLSLSLRSSLSSGHLLAGVSKDKQDSLEAPEETSHPILVRFDMPHRQEDRVRRRCL